METLGVILVFGGILAFLVTGLGYARKQKALIDCLKNKHSEQWIQLGKPELSPWRPFNSVPLYELLASKGGSFEECAELTHLHSRARFWFFAFGLNFGVVFFGLFILGVNS